MPERDRRRPRVIAIAAATSLVVAGSFAATYTPLFAASDIQVVGSSLPRRVLLELAGIDDRTNVFHLDTAAVERRLEVDPRVLDATVIASLPSHVRIEVAPRRPVAVVGTSGILIGSDGTEIGPAGSRPRELPLLRGEDLVAAAATAAAMGNGLRRAVEVIAARPDGGISVRLEAGFSADLGVASELPAKTASLAALLRWATARNVRVVSADVTVAGSPTAKLADGETAAPSG